MKPVAPLIPPVPKYWIGETIYFDRSALTYAQGEGQQLGKIHLIELRISEAGKNDTERDAGKWQVAYYTEHDDPVPEECILGPATLGTPR